ncbi:GNAT family N-acetyltransferase [Stakelama marina]|uniref:GNAT family N-acetyltransferase n=1 Tax=Stakelama marina TaxID=2826939 RepID=A0A8T4IHD2_9SPHN|nr:GNAT family N-acetyltransferase [Stakelama marina]MBR0553284.1 GNAT family N-acetyltransferase [Stakelama marina]
MTFTIDWAPDALMEDVARFFARVISGDDSYISHGEVQTGLSSDGRHWAPDLAAKMIADFEELGPCRSVAVASDGGRIVGAAVLLWVRGGRVAYCVLEDLAVDPAVRNRGVGADLVAFAEEAARERGMAWIFLESGLHNHGAHRLFERSGFRPISKVFLKPLGATE